MLNLKLLTLLLLLTAGLGRSELSGDVPALGKTHRAIALDLPGCGLSDKPLDVTYNYDPYANTLNAEVSRMAQLISNLLQLSRIQLGNLSAQRGFVKPAPLNAERAWKRAASLESPVKVRAIAAILVTSRDSIATVKREKMAIILKTI